MEVETILICQIKLFLYSLQVLKKANNQFKMKTNVDISSGLLLFASLSYVNKYALDPK